MRGERELASERGELASEKGRESDGERGERVGK